MTAGTKAKDRVRIRNVGREEKEVSLQSESEDNYNLPTLVPSFSNDSFPLPTIEIRNNNKTHRTSRIQSNVGNMKRRKPRNLNSKPHLKLAQNNDRRKNLSFKDNRSLFTRQMQLLACTSGASFVLFLLFFLPTTAFLALVVGVVSTLMLCYTLFNYAMFLLDQDQDEAGTGALFEFLPASIQEYLCNTSMHEAMTNADGYAGQIRIKSVESGESIIHNATAKIAQFARVH